MAAVAGKRATGASPHTKYPKPSPRALKHKGTSLHFLGSCWLMKIQCFPRHKKAQPIEV